MKVQDFKVGCGFIVEGMALGHSCDCIAQYPGVTFTVRRRFFWSAGDIRAEFALHGHIFKVEPWDIDEALFVSPKEQGIERPEIAELRDHVARTLRNEA